MLFAKWSKKYLHLFKKEGFKLSWTGGNTCRFLSLHRWMKCFYGTESKWGGPVKNIYFQIIEVTFLQHMKMPYIYSYSDTCIRCVRPCK